MRFERGIVSRLLAAPLIGLALWIGEGAYLGTHVVADRTLAEAPSRPTLRGTVYEPNTFSWPMHDVGSPQGSGIARAWRALDEAVRLVLACAAMTWTSSDAVDTTPLTGCKVDVMFGTLGSRTLLLSGIDPRGPPDSDLVTIDRLRPAACQRRSSSPARRDVRACRRAQRSR